MSIDKRYSIQLVSPEDTHSPVDLPHKTPVVVGRIQEMRIIDPRCSRKQVELTANCHTGEVTVKQVGPNSSALDGIELIENKEYKMKPGSTLFILTGLYPQKLKIVDNRKSEEAEKNEVDKTNKTQNMNGEINSEKSDKTEKGKSHKEDSNKKKHSDKCKDSSSKSDEKDSVKSRDSDSDKKHSSKRDSDSDKKHSSKRDSDSDKKHHSKSGVDKSKENGKSATKRKSSSDDHKLFKKPKLSDTEDSTPKKSVKFSVTSDKHEKVSNNSLSEDEDLNDVAAKLKAMKENAKKLKIPEKESNTATASGKTVTKPYWEHVESLYVYRSKHLCGRPKIAAFDVDGTIITTQSGKVFPTHPGDWRLLYYSEIKKKINKLHGEGFKIVFISNQMGVSRGKAKIEDLQTKFQNILAEFDFPIQVLLATKSDIYRKPCIGMWQYLCDKGNDGVPIDTTTSFYVGDAAGRPKDWQPKKKKDFSCSDRLFALNVGIKFFTPEEFFLGYPTAKWNMPEFDPRRCSSRTPLLMPEDSQLISDTQEVLVLVGSPASGKSWLVKTHLVPKGYCHINRDTLGTWQKCVSEASSALKRGQSVVIDNTNPDVESRGRYIAVAKKVGVKCRCFVFTTSHAQARHNERFREITDKSHQPINDMILNSYKKKFVPPEKKEGFSEIVKVNCVPKFTDSKLEELYRKFLIDK